MESYYPRSKADWVRLFKNSFRFTGGEITGEFLTRISYLLGAHDPNCSVYARILELDPSWERTGARAP